MLKKLLVLALGFSGLLASPLAIAAGGPGVEVVNFYSIALHAMGVRDEHITHEWTAVLAGMFSLLVLVLIGIYFRSRINSDGDDIVPSSHFSLRTIVEVVIDFIHGLASDVIGKNAQNFMGLLTALFAFILLSNLSGLVPGFPPATESLNTNLAMGLVVFVIYNIAGLREHKGSYIKQFLGPVWWLAPLLFGIELVSHLARPVSLSLRLYGNIFGDHLVLSVFTGLSYVVLPAFLLFFGLLVATLQSFVFTLLSSIYISLAISHDH